MQLFVGMKTTTTVNRHYYDDHDYIKVKNSQNHVIFILNIATHSVFFFQECHINKIPVSKICKRN